jgi:hypothetical protein
MLVAASVVFLYYTIWALAMVRPAVLSRRRGNMRWGTQMS